MRLRRRLLLSFMTALILHVSVNCCAAQDKPNPLNPNDPRLNFSFPIQSGGKPFHFKVEIDKSGTILGLEVYMPGSASPFQHIQTCAGEGSTEQLGPYADDDAYSQLLAHADFNFDGFEDIELLTDYIPHLDKKLYCIYLWDNKADHFVYSPELSGIAVDPVPDPENKTITTREDWQGGAWQVSTYLWDDGKLELIEQESLLGDWSQQTAKECGFAYTCSRLIGGKMVVTLGKDVCTPEEMDQLPSCPAASSVSKSSLVGKKQSKN